MKRVLCLYRVSTKGQVDNKDDIPMQRRECMAFIEHQEDWVFIGERLEKGVSGFKVATDKRDVIIEIRQMAERKLFDVLLVFMFDRLGRREDETPFLVQWFIDHGIEVWSTREGQQRLENRVDKLLNFIRFWQAGGESEKTSLRVKAAHTQMTADGIWRGGACPYGYKLVHNGRVGKKNRPLYDLAIDEITGPIVIELFDLVVNKGYGTLRAANYMNWKHPSTDKIWTAQTVRNMIRNPIYTGRMHMNDTLSEPNEKLRLVSDEDLEFGTYAIAERIPRKYITEREAEDYNLPENTTKASIYGATLLSGLLYCGHCGKKLVGGYNTRQLATHAYHRPLYRCYNGAVKAKNCDGPCTYSARKVEKAVLDIVHGYFTRMGSTVDEVWKEQARKQLRAGSRSRKSAAEANLARLQKEQDSLKKEVVKCISGTSEFDIDLLRELLTENKAAETAVLQELEQIESETADEESRIRHLAEQYKYIKDWAEAFDKVPADTKKMILARLIRKITITRGYHITIHFFVTLEDFFDDFSATEEQPQTPAM